MCTHDPFPPPPCALCRFDWRVRANLAPDPHDVVLLESPGFLVVPCIGPMVPGHVMVVSRRHFSGLAAMDSPAIEECVGLIAQVVHQLPSTYADALVYEHGGAPHPTGGPCIEHTHLHMIPGASKHARILDGQLPLLPGLDRFAQVLGLSSPYIAVQTANGPARIYDASNAGSQILRRLMREEEGKNDFDWRQSPRHDWIDRTLRLWGKT